MQATRPYVVSIAGFDPSAGAGVLADCKTFEQHEVYGFGVCSAMTIQNDSECIDVRWLRADDIIEQLQPLTKKFSISACKIGIIQSLDVLQPVLQFLRANNPHMHIVWDPVLNASAGYAFHAGMDAQQLQALLAQVDLLTPNYEEWQQMQALCKYPLIAGDQATVCAILLKGGHRADARGTDILYERNEYTVMPSGITTACPKHGSGCVLSAAIAARLALSYGLKDACRLSKQYTERFLNSSDTLLGHHYAG